MKKILIIACLWFPGSLNAQNFMNASVELWGIPGVCEVNIQPDDWTNYTNGGIGPDEANFSICPTTIPPNASNGNVYARMYAQDNTSGEGMFQNISGFVPGNVYDISFDYAGSNLYGGTNDSRWHLFIDDVDVDQTPVFQSTEINWSSHSFSFTASATTHKIGVRLYTTPNPTSTGSGAIDNFTLTIDSSSFLPSGNFFAADTVLCEKFCINFFDQSTNNPTSWQWQFPGGDPSSSTGQNPTNICYNSPGTYDVTLITTNAYGNDTLTLHNYITVYPTPPFPTITQVGYTLTSSPAPYYQWQLNSANIPGATNQSYTILQSGYYTVVVGDSNGCINSFTEYVLISGIDDGNGDANISIYPNPSSGSFIVELLNRLTVGEVSIDVVNTLGQIIFSSIGKVSSSEFKKEIDLGNVAGGIYFIEIKTRNEFVKEKIIISK